MRIPFNLHLSSARITGVALAAALLLTSPIAPAKDTTDPNGHWSEWKGLGGGYVARRRVPDQAKRAHKRRLGANRSRKGKKRPVNPATYASAGLRSFTQSAAVTNEIRPNAVWLGTGEEGLYGAPISDLAAALGKSANSLRRRANRGYLSLTNAGERTSWYFDSETDMLLFPGTAYETFHSDENAYRFSLSSRHALPMRVTSLAQPTATGEATPFQDTLTFEQEPDFYNLTWVVASEPDADYWFWDYLHGGFKDLIEVALPLPNPASNGSAQLRVTLRGWTDLEPGDEHQVSAYLNDTYVGSTEPWDGFAKSTLVADFDQGLLYPDGNNTLHLRNDYAVGTHPGQFLDAVEVDYLRQPVAVDGALWMHEVAAGVQTVSGFARDDIRVIESPAGDAVLREDVRVDPDGNGGWSVTFSSDRSVDYLIAESGAIDPVTTTPDYPSTLRKRSNQADYLVIAPAELEGTAETLAEYRTSRFGHVKIAWLNDIYDEFSDGRVDPSALARFMRRAIVKWDLAPSMVVLLGKGTLDHKDRMDYADSLLPVVLTSTPWSLTASDPRLLGFEDETPFAIGRIPVTSDVEGIAYVDKLIEHESRKQTGGGLEAVLAADNPDQAGDFHTNSEVLADRLLYSLDFDQVTQLHHAVDDVREDLIDSATWLTDYVSYDGHGSATQVGDANESFITAADAAKLDNDSYPIFTALTCAAGDDTLPGTRSLAGALVLNPFGGAIASLAPTGLSYDSDAQQLGTAFVDKLFGKRMSIGEAVKEAKVQTSDSISAFMPRMYSVVGDPAVTIP